jgi:hypothetical protein
MKLLKIYQIELAYFHMLNDVGTSAIKILLQNKSFYAYES